MGKSRTAFDGYTISKQPKALIVLQHGVDRVNIAGRRRFDHGIREKRGLRFSLDALFLEKRDGEVPISVKRYFSGMSEEKARKYIALCEQADLLSED